MSLPAAFAKTTTAPSPEAAGALYIVRCEPDPFTGERLNVGVFGVERGGRRLAKMLQQPGRLECLYGRAASDVLWLAKAAEEAAMAGLAEPSPQLRFDGPMPYYHSTLEDAVQHAFAEMVTAALPQRDRQAAAATKVTDDDALELVSQALKGMIGLDFGLIANTPHVLIDTDRGPWTVHVPLQPKRGAGVIRSADYGPQSLKTHLMDSVLDLECAATYRQRRDLGLFLLRPSAHSPREAMQVDDVVDSVMRRAPRNLRFEQADDPAILAKMIHDWSRGLSADA
ncbi:MAG: hypothetical protein L6Q68_02445 [Aquabacterium sp.]|nr:hypothetical protein [Aquabacterium sp.]